MYKFGKRSREALESAHPTWTKIMNEVIKHVDCSVLEGHRSQLRQNELCREGRSQLRWPNSKHNSMPSIAIDVVPYPIDWKDHDRLRGFAFFVKGVAASMGHKVRLGADWDGDFTCKDQRFHDLPHMELLG